MQRISRAPYPSFAIDEPFQSFLNIFSAYIEPADRLFLAICHTNVSFLLLYFGHHNERNTLWSDFCKSFTIGLSGSDGLQLEVVNSYFCFLHRFGIQDVAYGNPQFVQ